MPVTVTPGALAAGTPLSVTDCAVAAGTHTDAVRADGNLDRQGEARPPSWVQAELTRPSGVVS